MLFNATSTALVSQALENSYICLSGSETSPLTLAAIEAAATGMQEILKRKGNPDHQLFYQLLPYGILLPFTVSAKKVTDIASFAFNRAYKHFPSQITGFCVGIGTWFSPVILPLTGRDLTTRNVALSVVAGSAIGCLVGVCTEAGLTATFGWALIVQEAAVDFPAMLISKLGANYFRKKLLSGIRPPQNP
jgi:Na+-translocating ferredoxin:NAD+ oxidoreductase RnfA subunit